MVPGHSLIGGNLEEIPGPPYKRYFDDKRRKRRVDIFISMFSGAGVHYHVWLKEEGNPIWNKKDKLWQYARNDNEGKGREFHEKFNTIKGANSYVERMQKKYFLEETHVLHRSGSSSRKWYYKEGD